MRNGGKARFKRTKIDELMNYMVYTVSQRRFILKRGYRERQEVIRSGGNTTEQRLSFVGTELY